MTMKRAMKTSQQTFWSNADCLGDHSNYNVDSFREYRVQVLFLVHRAV